MNEIYEGIDRKYWHNAILSVEDGLLLYQFRMTELPPKTKKCYENTDFYADNKVINYQYSQHIFKFKNEIESYDCTHYFLQADPAKQYNHIMKFLSYVKQSVNEMVKYKFDSMEYINR